MVINKVKKYKDGIRVSPNVMDNLKDLFMMFRKPTRDLKAEIAKTDKENDRYSKIASRLYQCVERIIKDKSVGEINIYVTDNDIDLFKSLIVTYDGIIKRDIIKSNSIKGGWTCTIKRK